MESSSHMRYSGEVSLRPKDLDKISERTVRPLHTAQSHHEHVYWAFFLELVTLSWATDPTRAQVQGGERHASKTT